MKLPRLEDLPDVSGRRVLVRCDFNVPLEDGRITDDSRIRAALPTLSWLLQRGAAVTACTHLGRPKGSPDPRYDISPVRERLSQLAPGVALLDNLRFSPGEEANDPAFVDRLVSGQDFYVNDAFASSHRPHASIVGPPARLPSAAGRLLEREAEALSALLESPRHPFVAVLGGAKVSDKIGLIASLVERVDTVLVGGAMCFTFLASGKHATGDSVVEEAWLDRCHDLLHSGKIVLPADLVVVPSEQPGQAPTTSSAVPRGWKAFDIGPTSAAVFAKVISQAATVVWNGPMGVFEDPRFASGTATVAQAMADSEALTVAGGGDTVAAINKLGLAQHFGHISTGGGAMLEFMEHGDLPGLRALRESVLAPAGR